MDRQEERPARFGARGVRVEAGVAEQRVVHHAQLTALAMALQPFLEHMQGIQHGPLAVTAPVRQAALQQGATNVDRRRDPNMYLSYLGHV